MLGTHSAQTTESGLLDSNDQYTLFAWYEWYVEHTWHTWLKLTHINLYYECILFFRKKKSRYVFVNKNLFDSLKKKLNFFLCRLKK